MADASFDFSLGDFEVDRAGIQEIFKGAGMRSALAEVARSMSASATAEARGRDPSSEATYSGGVDVAHFTAIGWVGTGNQASREDEAAHHTLEHQNH